MTTDAMWFRAFCGVLGYPLDAVFIGMAEIALANRDDPELVWC